MHSKSKKLFGKDLEAILQISAAGLSDHVDNKEDHSLHAIDKLQNISIEALKPGTYQARENFNPESLQELAVSIKAQGILQPIVVRNTDSGYEIVAGERRWRAAKIAGLAQVPVIVSDVTAEGAAVVGLIENLQRQDLNPIEEAKGYKQLIEKFAMTHEQIAESVGKSRTTITNMLRLLSLEAEVCAMVHDGLLEMGHARALLMLNKDGQIELAKTIAKKNLSVRETEKLVKDCIAKQGKNDRGARIENSIYSEKVVGWQRRLWQSLKLDVQVKINAVGKGRAVIYFDTPEELEEIIGKVEAV